VFFLFSFFFLLQGEFGCLVQDNNLKIAARRITPYFSKYFSSTSKTKNKFMGLFCHSSVTSRSLFWYVRRNTRIFLPASAFAFIVLAVQLSWSASSSLSPSSKLRAHAQLGNDQEDIANFDKHIKNIESGLSPVKFALEIDQVRFGLVRQDTKIMCIVFVMPT
jgi:hypothetical protein